MKCIVCEINDATKFNHFGSVEVCHSCRGFFWRSVQSSMFKVFKHNKDESNGSCIIDSKNRKSCKRCRFDKCLQAGMKVAFVKSSLSSQKRELLFANVLTLDEENQLVNLYNTGFDASNDRMYEIFESDLKLAHLMLDEVHRSLHLTDKNLNVINRLDRLTWLTMFEALGKENQMHPTVIQSLAEHNFGRITSFLSFVWFGRTRTSCKNDLTMRFICHGKQSRKPSEAVETILQLAEKQAQERNDWYKYEIIYKSPWAADSSIEDEHKSIADKIRQWYEVSKKPTEEIDACLMVIMMQILFYNSDGLQLSEANAMQVQQSQQICAKLLLKYLKGHLPNQSSYSKLHTGLMIVSDSQRAYELSQQRLHLDMTDTEESLDIL